MPIEGQPSVSEPPDTIPLEASEPAAAEPEQRGVKIEKVPAAIDEVETADTKSRAASLDEMMQGKQELPELIVFSARAQLSEGPLKRTQDFIDQQPLADNKKGAVLETVKNISETISKRGVNLQHIDEFVQTAVKENDRVELFSLKLVASRLLRLNQSGGKETWPKMDPENREAVRAAQMMLQMAEMGAIEMGIKDGTLKKEQAEKFAKQFARFRESKDIPDSFAGKLTESISLIQEKFPSVQTTLAESARKRVAERLKQQQPERPPKPSKQEEGLVAPLAEKAPEAKAAALPPPLPPEAKGPPPLTREAVRQAQWEAMQKTAAEVAAKAPDELYNLTEKERIEWENALHDLQTPQDHFEQQMRTRLEQTPNLYSYGVGDKALREGFHELLTKNGFFASVKNETPGWMKRYLENIDDEFAKDNRDAEWEARVNLIGGMRAVTGLIVKGLTGWRPFKKLEAMRRHQAAGELLKFAERVGGDKPDAAGYAKQVAYSLEQKVLEGWLRDRGMKAADEKAKAATVAETMAQAAEAAPAAPPIEAEVMGQVEVATEDDPMGTYRNRYDELLSKQIEIIDDGNYVARNLKGTVAKMGIEDDKAWDDFGQADNKNLRNKRTQMRDNISKWNSVLLNLDVDDYGSFEEFQAEHRDIVERIRRRYEQLLDMYAEAQEGEADIEAPSKAA